MMMSFQQKEEQLSDVYDIDFDDFDRLVDEFHEEDQEEESSNLWDSDDDLDRLIDDFELDPESSVGSSSSVKRAYSNEEEEEEEEISSKRRKKNPNGDDTKFLSFSDFEEQQSIITSQSSDPQPSLIRPVWSGGFNVIRHNSGDDSVSTKVGGLFAGVSFNKLCAARIYREASQFKEVMQLDLLPKSKVWPKSFCDGSGPTEDNIAVYFFSSSSEEENVYDKLMFQMISDDLAMRAFSERAELLIFSSVLLPPKFWRIQGKLYLWGVFREYHI